MIKVAPSHGAGVGAGSVPQTLGQYCKMDTLLVSSRTFPRRDEVPLL